MDGKEIKGLAARCGVPMHRACKRAGVAPTTPWRWEHGGTAQPETVERLERAIYEIARDQGSVPEDMADRARTVLEKEIPAPSTRSPREIISRIRGDLKELGQVIQS